MNAAETVENMEGGLQHIMRNVEKEVIARTLKQTNGHRTRAASELGINRKTLFKKMKAYGIKVA
jgi:DNA-binding NtrC family response regulator